MVTLSGMLAFMVVFFSVYGSWWRLNKLKQIALYGAAQRCQESGVQLLDGTISLKRLWFRRNDAMKLSIWAAYEFEFASLGRHRYRGCIVLLGEKILSIEMEPHVIGGSDENQ